MFITIQRMKLLLLVFIFAFFFGQTAWAADKDLFQPLISACEKSDTQFEEEMRRLRGTLKREIESMNEEQFKEASDRDDPRFIFMAVAFPGDLETKDVFADSYRDCAELHGEARKALQTSAAATRAERVEKVDALKTCLLMRYDHKKLLAPTDRILACYQKRAAKSK